MTIEEFKTLKIGDTVFISENAEEIAKLHNWAGINSNTRHLVGTIVIIEKISTPHIRERNWYFHRAVIELSKPKPILKHRAGVK